MMVRSASFGCTGAPARHKIQAGLFPHGSSAHAPHAVRQVAQVATMNDASEVGDVDIRDSSFDALESRRVSSRDASSSTHTKEQGQRRKTRISPSQEPGMPPNAACEPSVGLSVGFTIVSPASPRYVLGNERDQQAVPKKPANIDSDVRKASEDESYTSSRGTSSSSLLEALSSLESVVAGADAAAELVVEGYHEEVVQGPKFRHNLPGDFDARIKNAPNLRTLYELDERWNKRMRGCHTVAMIKRFAAIMNAAGHPSLTHLPSKSQHLWLSLCERVSVLSPSFSVKEAADILHAIVVVYQNKSPYSEAANTGGELYTWQQLKLTPSNASLENSSETPSCNGGQRSSSARPCVVPASSLGSNGPMNSIATLVWDGDIMSSAGARRGTATVRPLAMRRRLPHAIEDLILVLTQNVPAHLSDPDLRPVDFSRLVVSLGRLGNSKPNADWYAVFFAATQPYLSQCSLVDLLTMSYGLGRLCPKAIPTEWSLDYFRLTQRQLKNLSMREMCMLLHAVAHLPVRPPPLWLQETMHRSTEMFDHFDAPAYSMTLHALGMLSFRPPRAWVEEFMDSCATVLNDFSPEELSLLLRGCALMKLKPNGEWLHELYFQSRSKLASAGGPQLAEIAWALATLNLQPPKSWVHEYVQALSRQVSNIGTKVHAQRTAYALQHFRVKDLQGWCRRLKVEELPDKAPWEEEQLSLSSVMSVSSLSSIDDYGL